MIEQQRLHYLAALGIDNYIPKRVLPNAAVSPALVAYEPVDEIAPTLPANEPINVEPTEVEPIVESDNIVQMNNDPSSQLAPASLPPTVETTETTSVEPSEVIAATSVVKAKPLRFTLSLWAITPQLLVVDTRQAGSALPTDKLLQNILRAVGYPLAQLPPSDLVRWPIFKQDPHANNTDEAFAMVQANIGARCAKVSGVQLLLMGETAVELVIGRLAQYEHYEQHLGQCLVCESWQASAIVLPSLVEILEEPSRKALVWQALQPLLHAEQ